MLRCRENDLAIVLSGPYLGFTVTVGEFIGDSFVHTIEGNLSGTQRNLWAVRNKDIELAVCSDHVYCPDHHLQPIRGRGVDQTTTAKKEIGA